MNSALLRWRADRVAGIHWNTIIRHMGDALDGRKNIAERLLSTAGIMIRWHTTRNENALYCLWSNRYQGPSSQWCFEPEPQADLGAFTNHHLLPPAKGS